MKPYFRLTKTTDFQRVRQNGKSFVHPLIVLLVLPNELSSVRIAVSASRVVGNAVQRNRAKRRLREVCRTLLDRIKPGFDLLLLARNRTVSASFLDLQSAVQQTLRQANLID